MQDELREPLIKVESASDYAKGEQFIMRPLWATVLAAEQSQ